MASRTPNAAGSATSSAERACRLCGLPLRGGDDEEGEFCCAGCARVYDVLHGLDESAAEVYLEAARRLGVIPGGEVGSGSAASELPEDSAAVKEERFDVEGMTCPSCSWVLQQVLLADGGVRDAEVDFFSGSAKVRYDLRRTSSQQMQRLLRPLGYRLTVPEGRDLKKSVSRGTTFAFVVCAILTMNMMSLAAVRYFELFDGSERAPLLLVWLELLLLLPVLWLGWVPALLRAVAGLGRGRMTMDFLIAVGVGAAFVLSLAAMAVGSHHIYFETCAGLVTISLLSRMIEARLRERAFADIATLMRMRVVRVRTLGGDGVERYRRVDDLSPGSRVRFVAGDSVPVDGTVVGGEVLVSEAVLTGEPRPVRKVAGDPVAAGSEVVAGELVADVKRPFRETTLFRITEGVAESLRKSESRLRSADRIAQWFSPSVLAVALLTWAVRLGLFGWEFAISAPGWFPSVAVLAVACPCAFSLAGTAALTAATGSLLRRGVLVKELEQLESLHRTERVIFDKTGTLTDGDMSVEALVWRGEPRPELLSLVLEAERGSVHPIAQALRKHLEDLEPGPAGDRTVEDFPGQGRVLHRASGCQPFRIGAASLFAAPFIPERATPRHTAVWFGFGKEALGCFLITDAIKRGARDMAVALREEGYDLEMLSGDRQEVCDWVAREVGIDRAYGQVSLEEKVERVRCARSKGSEISFVGDGTNDALAMSEASTSVALARSTDEALAACGFVMLRGQLSSLPGLYAAGRKLHRVIRMNYVWAFGFNTVFVPIAAAGKLTPLAAMLLMLASSTAVLLNSLRMRGGG